MINITRRTALLGATALSACTAGGTSTVTQATINAGVADAGAVVTAIATMYGDLKQDGLVKSTDTAIAGDIAAAQQAVNALVGLGANPPASGVAGNLSTVIGDFNTVAAAINAILPAAAAVDPGLAPIVLGFQAATLIVQTVIEPLVTQLVPSAAVRAIATPVRFQPPADLTLDQARATLTLIAHTR